MSKNISKLSGRIGLKNNLFQKLSDRSLNSKNGEGMKELAEKYQGLGKSFNNLTAIHTNFYFLKIKQSNITLS